MEPVFFSMDPVAFVHFVLLFKLAEPVILIVFEIAFVLCSTRKDNNALSMLFAHTIVALVKHPIFPLFLSEPLLLVIGSEPLVIHSPVLCREPAVPLIRLSFLRILAFLLFQNQLLKAKA